MKKKKYYEKFPGGRAIKDPALSLLWCIYNPWPWKFCKLCHGQKLNKLIKNIIKVKKVKRSKQTFLLTDGQKTHEKTFNITNYQRSANQSYNDISPHTSQNGQNQQVYKK